MNPRHILAQACAVAVLGFAGAALASPPVAITDANTEANPVTFSAGPYVARTAETDCVSPDVCDDTALTVAVTPEAAASRRVVVRIDWGEPIQADFDLYVAQGEDSIAASASTTDPEIARFAANNGVYNIHVVPYQPFGNTYTAKIYLEPLPPTGTTVSGPVAGFQIFAPPAKVGANGGEPSIGANWKTGTAVVGNSDAAIFITFDDGKTPATAAWENRPPSTNAISFDPILFTDRETGRTVVSQLVTDAVLFSTGCSLSSVTDDDGKTWVPAEGCGPPAGADHQGIGGGPYAPPLAPLPPLNQNAVYYCAQAVGVVLGDATCSRSDDGGLTYGPGVVVYTSECGGLHGHPRVAPDGTVYLPNKACAGGGGLGQGVAVSTDNGLTWRIGAVPGSTPGASDPSVATGLTDAGKPAAQASNTVYLGYCDGDGRAKVAVSRDRGSTWGDTADVGQAAAVRNCVFPAMIAGDDDRAALFFIGTSTPGAFQSDAFTGEWHAYVATTYDGGKSWGLTDATPDDPVQIGCIWMQGGSNPCRNLLDFNDITLDKEGRPLFVFADGCIPSAKCVPGALPRFSRKAVDTVGRQSSCRTLFSQHDKTVGAAPCAESARPVPARARAEGRGFLIGGMPLLLTLPLAAVALLRRRRPTASRY
ncbi:MAG: exo-alpha-sialidase [Gammaproteobacteria bacterium]|nr:exo-alpha-sialidase [Gammaproteobacteria bacterium]